MNEATAPKHWLNRFNQSKTGVRKKSAGLIGDIRKSPYSYLLVLPALVYTIVYGYVTLPYIAIAFQKFNYVKGIWGSEWIGLKNFEFFFSSPTVWLVTWNTIKLNLLFLFSGTIFALLIAVLIHEIRNKLFLRITQSTYLFPHFLSWIIVSYIVYVLFSTQYGVVNSMLESVGFSPVKWYNDPAPWPWILVLANLWKNSGLDIVIYLAAIASIDNDLYEAAVVDGAGRWQRIKHITLPLLLPTIAILTLLALGRIFNGDFGMIYALVKDNGMLYPTTDIIDTYVFRAFRLTGDPAQATAIGLYQSVVGFMLVVFMNKIVKKLYPDGALF